MAKLNKIPDDQFAKIIAESKSHGEVLRTLGMRGGGSNFSVKARIKEMGLDTSHFVGQGWNKGLKLVSDDEIFRENSRHSAGSIRNHVIDRSIVVYRCAICDIPPEWMGHDLSLELDHIDGDSTNNTPGNLRFLCPNCHSQTPTFRGRNVNTGSKKVSDEDLLESIKSSDSLRQALIKVGLAPKGGNYGRCYKLMAMHQLKI